MTITIDYGSVSNGQRTFDTIAMDLYGGEAVVIAWTDGEGSQYDILFVTDAKQYGQLQGGVHADTDLFVGIMRKGCFGFDLNHHDTHPGYFCEKLNMGGGGDTPQKLADLVNGVRKSMLRLAIERAGARDG